MNDNSLRLYKIWDNSNSFIADGSEIWQFMARSGWRGIWFRGVLRGLHTLVHVLCWKPGCLRLEVLLAKLKKGTFFAKIPRKQTLDFYVPIKMTKC